MGTTKDRELQQRTLAHYRAEADLASAIRAQWLELELLVAERDILLEQVDKLEAELERTRAELADAERLLLGDR